MERLTLLKNEKQIISPPKIQSLMTGVLYATFKCNILSLHYSDGTTESAKCTDKQFDNLGNFFNVVGFVHDQRAKQNLTGGTE